ncbi:MAG: band 7 protein [Cyanobacteria bacterium RYN_339]|nr:band 7 protein [Cyanobacteria bacterium RYN_339]
MDPIWLGGIFAIVVLAIVGGAASIYRRVPPNRALIVYGAGLASPKIVTGGGALVIPVFRDYKELSLELMSFDVMPQHSFYTKQGIAVNVEAVAQIKVKSDPVSIRTAAEQFLSKSPADREMSIRQVMEGHLRGIVGTLTIEQIVKEPEEVAGKVRDQVADDVTKMGLEVVSFTIKEVGDDQNYITNMGLPEIARIRRTAEVAKAEAERDIAISKANAAREAAVSQAAADQARVLAQSISETAQAEAVRDLNLKKAEYEGAVNHQKAVAEKAYEISANQSQQKVIAEQVRISQIEKQEQLKVQELEVRRRELELQATTIKQAEAEQRRVMILAEADKQKIFMEAAGRAEAIRQQGNAEAEITLARGKAEAEIIKTRGEAEAAVVAAKGQAEAEAMQKKADAYERYTQAAILDRMLSSLPEMAQAFASALASVDKITIVSTGDGKGGGASALTGEVAKMVAQMPAMVETITGMKVSDLLDQVRGTVSDKVIPVKIEDA